MSKKNMLIVAIVLLTVMTSVFSAIPAMAAGGSVTQSSQNVAQAGNVKVLLRLMLMQEESKVDMLLAQAVTSGKLTSDKASKIKEFWTQNHAQFAKNVVLKRLLSAKEGSKVQAFLDKAVQDGKIKQEQADKVLQIWRILHTPASNKN